MNRDGTPITVRTWKSGNVLEITLFVVTGMLAFSGLSFYLSSFVLRSVYYFPEMFLIPLLLVKWRAVRIYSRRLLLGAAFDHRLLLWLLLWLLLVGLGYVSTGNIVDVLATARPILYIILIAYVVAKEEAIDSSLLFWISFGALIGELIQAVFHAELYGISGQRYVVGVNLIAVFFCMSLPIVHRKPLLQLVSALIVGLLIILSGYRIVLLVAIVGFVGTHLLMATVSRRGRLYRLIGASAIVAIAILVTTTFVTSYGVRDYAVFRIVTRTEGLLKGNIFISQDTGRINKLSLVWSSTMERALPHGFETKGNGLIGLHNDVPVLFFYDTLGFPFAVLLLGWILYKGFAFFILELRHPKFNADTSMAVGFILFLALLCFNGRFLYITYESWLFAIILGRWVHPRRSPGKHHLISKSHVIRPIEET